MCRSMRAGIFLFPGLVQALTFGGLAGTSLGAGAAAPELCVGTVAHLALLLSFTSCFLTGQLIARVWWLSAVSCFLRQFTHLNCSGLAVHDLWLCPLRAQLEQVGSLL